MDQDNSNTIEIGEFQTLFKKHLEVDIEFRDIKSLFEAIDTNGSGHVSFTEFINYFNAANMEYQRVERKKFLRKRFEEIRENNQMQKDAEDIALQRVNQSAENKVALYESRLKNQQK
jgi:Ca2+-binding EF-hand superfamily protein